LYYFTLNWLPFFDWDEVNLNEKKTITPSLSQLVSPPTADELLKFLPFHRKLVVATSPPKKGLSPLPK
jgi:hypothetical protein